MVKIKRNLNVELKRLNLPRRIVIGFGGAREMTQLEKRRIISKTKKFKTDFKKEGKLLGKKIVLFRGKKFTKEGVLL